MFYDFKVDVMKRITSSELYQTIEEFAVDYSIDCDIQPATSEIIKKTFGEEIKSSFIVFTDDDLSEGIAIKIKDKLYKINKKVDWINYKIYSVINI
ncbi:hypothetical protein QJR30_07620 [Paraclostridium sordellii]|uniref:hypothetical protein n=1 Tax=Paraclostridium sordellii TaxID=1505 RepID=UPI0030D0A73A